MCAMNDRDRQGSGGTHEEYCIFNSGSSTNVSEWWPGHTALPKGVLRLLEKLLVVRVSPSRVTTRRSHGAWSWLRAEVARVSASGVQ